MLSFASLGCRSLSQNDRVGVLFAAFAFFVCIVAVTGLQAQTTAFSYQGSLTDAGTPASGAFQMQFKLFDAVSGGTQVGSTIADVPVTASQGVFSAQLDFGSNALSGANRWLEIAIRHNSGESYSTILPRTQLTSSPYAVRTLSAASADLALDSNKLGGVAASSYLTTASAGNSFIKNGAVQQTGANFNIDGNGTVGSVSANGPVSLTGVAPPAAAPAGQGRIYFDSATNKVKVSESGSAFVNLVGATGVSGSGTTNALPLWTGGTALGNSLITQSGGVIQMPNNVNLAAGAQGNQVGFGSPNSETGMTISGASGRADLRYNGTLKLVNGPGGIPLGTNGLAIDSSGNVGIGTETPAAKLDIAAGGNGGKVSFGTPNGESGMSITGTNRADIRFDGSTLKLLAGVGTTAPCCGMFINTAGNVGIGTTTPAHRLSLIGGPTWTSNGWTGALELGNGSAIGWQSNIAGSRFGIGQSNGGLYFFGTASNPGTTGSPANYAMVINDNGNITQPVTANGLVKAMLYVRQDGVILQCYNGLTNSSTGNCGFNTIDHPAGLGSYYVQFPFQVDNRFVSVSARNPIEYLNGTFVGASFRFESFTGANNSSAIHVITFITSTEHHGGDEANFMLIVY